MTGLSDAERLEFVQGAAVHGLARHHRRNGHEESRARRGRLQLRLTPPNDILLKAAQDASILDGRIAARLTETFARSTGRP